MSKPPCADGPPSFVIRASSFFRHSDLGISHSPNMLQRVIDFSLWNKFFVVLATLTLLLGGIYAARHIPLDATHDVSDTQVMIYTEWNGQASNIVEDQVTYSFPTKMLSVPPGKV